MLNHQVTGTGSVTVFFLHLLCGSGRGWNSTIADLSGDFRCVAIDLPGFGGSSEIAGTSVAEMADAVTEVICAERPCELMLVGHSMGAKVATVVARRIETGVTEVAGLRGMVLLAGSPPAPEPMDEKRRETMKGWFAGDAAKSRAEADQFIDNNSSNALGAAEQKLLVEEVLRLNRTAWLAWLDSGSREDWSRRVGVLKTPTLIVAGAEDVDLGPDAQRSLMLPHFAAGRLEVLPGAKHLLPMECPHEVARLIAMQATATQREESDERAVGASYEALIDSDRVSPPTREVLRARSGSDDPAYEPEVFTLEELFTQRAVLGRIVPQEKGEAIDLAARLDRQLAGVGDGWRYAELPPDASAYRTALFTLDLEAKAAHKRPFGVLAPDEQDVLLAKASKGDLGSGLLQRAAVSIGLAEPEAELSRSQMRLWFKGLCGDAVRLYVAHPATLERIGYSGFADGADAATTQGFLQIDAGQHEPWEPVGKQMARR